MIIITTVTATENIATEQINIACDQNFYYKLHKCIKYIKEIQELKEMMNEAERERENRDGNVHWQSRGKK